MKYVALITKASRLVIDRPVLWVLGLFMAAGFNLNWIYLNALTHSNTVDRIIRRGTEIFHNTSWFGIILGGFIVVVAVVVASVIKIIFWQRGHQLIHKDSPSICEICRRPVNQSTVEIRPRSGLATVTIISLAAVVINALLTVSLHQLFVAQGISSFSAVLAICIAVIAIIVSLASVLAILFVIIQKQSLNNSIRLTIDLLRRQWLVMLEFSFWLLLFYGIAVIIGSAILGLSQNGFTQMWQSIQPFVALPRAVPATLASIATAVFWVWFAITNAWFNLSLLLLFGDVVRPTMAPEADLAAAKASVGI